MNTDVESLTNFHKLPNRISANSRIKYPQTPEWFIFSSYRKITFLGKTMSNPPHPSTKHISMAIQLKTGNERQVSGFGFRVLQVETRNQKLGTSTSSNHISQNRRLFTEDFHHRKQGLSPQNPHRIPIIPLRSELPKILPSENAQ